MALVAEWIIYFAIYSFTGWICESVYCSFFSKKLINRGFLAGPVCPVYGFGAMLLILLLTPVSQHILIVFLCGVMVTSVLEYFTGFLLETLFHMKWWDYSNYRFNISGRVCLLNSALFGLLSIILIELLNPFFTNHVEKIPLPLLWWLALFILFIFAIDLIFSVRATLNLKGKLELLHRITEELRVKSKQLLHEKNKVYLELLQQNIENKLDKIHLPSADETVQSLSQSIEKFKNRIIDLEHITLLHRRILDAFPHMKSSRYENVVEHIRETKKRRSLKGK